MSWLTLHLPGLWQPITRSHPHPWEAVDHSFDCGLVRKIKHHRRWAEEEIRNLIISLWSQSGTCHATSFVLLGRLTSVGHEDLQSGVLQQVASGEHSSDFTEHPFAVQTLRVGKHLLKEVETKKSIIKCQKFTPTPTFKSHLQENDPFTQKESSSLLWHLYF